MFKKILVAIAVVFPMLAAAQTIKIGVVDSQKIIPEMAAYKTAMTELEAMDKKYKDEYMKLWLPTPRLLSRNAVPKSWTSSHRSLPNLSRCTMQTWPNSAMPRYSRS